VIDNQFIGHACPGFYVLLLIVELKSKFAAIDPITACADRNLRKKAD
jgi:hypothetical protein